MKRFGIGIVVVMAFMLPSSDAGDREILRVTGTLQLPAGANYPARTEVKVDVAHVQPGNVVTFYRVVGSHEMRVIKSTPVQFKVPYTKKSLKDAPPSSFVLVAKVYDVGASPRKLLYEVPIKDAVPAFTDAGQPRQNVTLELKARATK